MADYLIYNKDTGQIARCITCPVGMIELQCRENEAFIEGSAMDDNLFYVSSGVVEERPEFDVSVTGHIISNVPEFTQITIDGEVYEADGHDIEFEPNLPGTYQIALACFPYQQITLEVTV